MKRLSYWSETLATNDGSIPALPEATDVAIVGAGFTGLSAALALAKSGARVVVLETHSVGWGASSRNGGMVLTGLKHGPHELVAQFGVDEARRLDAASIDAIGFVERLTREERIDCDFARCGHLALASKPAHYAQFERDATLVSEKFGRTLRLVAKKDLGTEIGSSAYYGALIDDASAAVNPAKLVYGLARAARGAGATICEHAPVHRIERRGAASPPFSVMTERGSVSAREVIVATGAYTGSESPWLLKRIVPIGSYIIATEPLSETLAYEIGPRNRMMYDSKRFLHYFRLTSDRRLLFGGRASFVPESDQAIAESAEILQRDMVSVFPQLVDVAIDYAWGGSIDFTADMMPHAGVFDGIHYAVGYAGHGVALAAYLGAQVASAIAGEVKTENPFMRQSFPAPPLGAHRIPGAVPAVGAWYRFLDMVS
jgi:glycine/D-amino acid oxidase-like deaminating enzyme